MTVIYPTRPAPLGSNYVELHGLDVPDPALDALHAEHIAGRSCPECGGTIELDWNTRAAWVQCVECGHIEEVA